MIPLDEVNIDRVAGTLLGLAVGDALGAGYEFGDPPLDEAEMIGGGLGPWAPGEWTDDTQMAVCIAQVTATGRLDLDGIAARFLSWYRDGPKDVGVQTQAVLATARGPADLPTAARTYHLRNPYRSAGNGSLMRTAPVALGQLGDPPALADAARAVSGLTHGDPLTGDACVLWCSAIDVAVREGRLDGVRDGLSLLGAEPRRTWTARIAEAADDPPARFRPNGFVVTALQAALSSIWQTPAGGDHFARALQTAIAIGDDTDTVGAITGALLGARWGASAIPLEWRHAVHGWPEGSDATTLVRLAILTARGGRLGTDDVPRMERLAGRGQNDANRGA